MKWSCEANQTRMRVQNVVDKCVPPSKTPVRGERNQSLEASEMTHLIMKTAHFNINMSCFAFSVASQGMETNSMHMCADIYQPSM